MVSLLTLLAVLASAPSAVALADSVRSDGEIREVVLRHAVAVRGCYETEGLRRNSALGGIVEVELRILPNGRVDSVVIVRSDLHGPGDRAVTACITAAARNWRFERGPYAVEAVVLPFVLRPERSASHGGGEENRRG